MSFWAFYPPILTELDKVEQCMLEAVSSRKPLLNDICTGLITRGGKRLRPGFTILAASLGKYDSEKVVAYAASLELIHTATLVHDDIIDESPLRRGAETTYAKWGKDMAVYTGDFLFTKAFSLLATYDADNNYLRGLAKAMQAICEGEVDQYEQKYHIPTVFDYLKRVERKSAILFSMACGMGADSAKCNKRQIKAISLFGTFYGIAFQIRDDLIDYMDTSSIVGKPIGSDIREGNFTLPILFALQDPTYGPKIETLLQAHEAITDDDIAKVIEYVTYTDALIKTRALAVKFLDKARSQLSFFPKKDVVKVYETLCDMLMA
ncbi:MAG: polyprenyl synthetase family protein [Cellulosilyticaceae bacterium]